MKTKYILLVFACMVLCSFSLFANKEKRTIDMQNVSIDIFEDWTTQKRTDKNGDFVLTCTKDNSISFVEITCKKRVINLNTRLNEIASERSLQKNFDYMQIDEITPVTFKKNKASLLTYTNTYLNEVSKGGMYAFIFEGYTYAIEYFGEDNLATRKELEKVVNSFKISSAEKTKNIIETEQEYQQQEWKNYNDTTSLETKVMELGKDLTTINTADNYKIVEDYTQKEIKLREQLTKINSQIETLNEELDTEKKDKQIKKINKNIRDLEKRKGEIEKELELIRIDNLKIKIKDK